VGKLESRGGVVEVQLRIVYTAPRRFHHGGAQLCFALISAEVARVNLPQASSERSYCTYWFLSIVFEIRVEVAIATPPR